MEQRQVAREEIGDTKTKGSMMSKQRLSDWKPDAFTAENLAGVTKRDLVTFLCEARLCSPSSFRHKNRAWLISQIIEEMTCADCATPIPFESSGSICESCKEARERKLMERGERGLQELDQLMKKGNNDGRTKK